ncbi:MAG: metallophosphoesterase [Fuerstiella sp.]
MNISLTGLLILLLACVGNAEWWIILVNRTHALPIREERLRRFRRLHDIAIVVFPVFLFLFDAQRPQSLMYGGQLQDAPRWMQVVLAISLTGLVPLLMGSLQWHLRPASRRHLSTTSQTIDCLSETSDSETAQAQVLGCRDSWLARLPGNQIFQIEVNQKRLRMPNRVDLAGSASAGNGETPRRPLRIAHFSDLHFLGTPGRGYHDFVVEQLRGLQPDLFVFTGDLLDELGLLPRATEMFRRLREIAPGYFILGNHDWHLNHEYIRRELIRTGWTSVADRCLAVTHAEHTLLIAGTEAPWIGGNPNIPETMNVDLRLLLSHSPDQRDYAVRNSFDLVLCGHNHGGQVVLPLIGPVYSPSIYGVKYAAGVFEHGQLMMHVSRGIGAKDPLRWNCLPEITALQLEFDGD